jgi:hypothetical protein
MDNQEMKQLELPMTEVEGKRTVSPRLLTARGHRVTREQIGPLTRVVIRATIINRRRGETGQQEGP